MVRGLSSSDHQAAFSIVIHIFDGSLKVKQVGMMESLQVSCIALGLSSLRLVERRQVYEGDHLEHGIGILLIDGSFLIFDETHEPFIWVSVKFVGASRVHIQVVAREIESSLLAVSHLHSAFV